MGDDTSEELDGVDYAVLKCLEDRGSCWKKEVHEWLGDNIGGLPVEEARSVQTVGRRIDALHERGDVESCILTPDEIDRDMIIGYKLTDQGQTALARKREAMMHDHILAAGESLLTSRTPELQDVNRDMLLSLISDEFDVDETTRDTILAECGTDELITLLAAHYFLENVEFTIDDENMNHLIALLRDTPRLRKPFEGQNVIQQLREHLAEGRVAQE